MLWAACSSTFCWRLDTSDWVFQTPVSSAPSALRNAWSIEWKRNALRATAPIKTAWRANSSPPSSQTRTSGVEALSNSATGRLLVTMRRPGTGRRRNSPAKAKIVVPESR